MTIIRSIFLLSISLLVLLGAKTPPSGPQVGDLIDNFALKNVDDKMLDLNNYLDQLQAKGVVITFMCNTCPYAIATEERLIAFDKKYKNKGYPVVAINPNVPKVSEDSFEKMQARAQSQGYSYPYLADATQSIARAFGASRTPHVFILQREENNNLRIKYIGAFDDNPMQADQVKNTYTETAIEELLNDQALSRTEVKAIGCTIKWLKK